MKLAQVAWISDLKSVAPPFEHCQADSLRWLARAHAAAEEDTSADRESPEERAPGIEKRLLRFGCGPDRIHRRRTWLEDVGRTDWEKRKVFWLKFDRKGAGFGDRMREFSRAIEEPSRTLLDGRAESEAPDELIHVSCTGYESPSVVQRWLADSYPGFGTRVSHAYHMGCYASIPALRMALGSIAAFEPMAGRSVRQIEILHTEYCTLHLDLSDSSPEQLVIQSLFADGAIRYTVTDQPPAGARCLRLVAFAEERIPGTAQLMTWQPGDHAMQMTLSREVPARIGERLAQFVQGLAQNAGLEPGELEARAEFAIHPGGPKILDQVQAILKIDPCRNSHSHSVLRERGNMSSATIPHIWERIVADRAILAGTPVVSLAFGPGLTICGAIARVDPGREA